MVSTRILYHASVKTIFTREEIPGLYMIFFLKYPQMFNSIGILVDKLNVLLHLNVQVSLLKKFLYEPELYCSEAQNFCLQSEWVSDLKMNLIIKNFQIILAIDFSMQTNYWTNEFSRHRPKLLPMHLNV